MLRNPKRMAWFYKDMDILVLPLAFVLIAGALSFLKPNEFLSAGNMTAMAFQIPELGLFTFAMMIAMITGGINLSIISTANLSGMVMALFMTRLLPEHLSPTLNAFALCGIAILGVAFAGCLGAVNGVLIAYAGTSPVLTSIGTMILYEGITLAMTKGYVVSGLPERFVAVGNATWLGVPAPFYLFLIASAVLAMILKWRPFGRYLFYVGSNSNAVAFSGINVKRVLIGAYALSGVYAGLAGLIMLSRLGSVNARYGAAYMLLAVLLSVLGGTNPDGGFGKISGILIGLLTLQTLTSGLNLMGVNSYVTVALWGVLLLLVIAWRRYAEARRNRWLMLQANQNSSG